SNVTWHQVHWPVSSIHLYSPCFLQATAPTDIYTLSLHDALPISHPALDGDRRLGRRLAGQDPAHVERRLVHGGELIRPSGLVQRSEEHTSELQSLAYLVCRLLLEKKKNTQTGGTSKEPRRIRQKT